MILLLDVVYVLLFIRKIIWDILILKVALSSYFLDQWLMSKGSVVVFTCI